MAPERERFLRHVIAEGRSSSTILQMMRHTLLAAEMLSLAAGQLVTENDLRLMADRWIDVLPRRANGKSAHPRKTIFVGHTRSWLRFIGRFNEETPVRPFGERVDQFIEFGLSERGLAEATCRFQRYLAHEFFAWVALNVGNDLSKLQVGHIMSYAQQASFSRKSRVYASGGITSLRVLLRWMVERGLCSKALLNCIQAPRLYQHERYPVGPSWSQIQELVRSADGDTIGNIRDRVILLLLAIYGLRVGEIRHLRLEDIDWENETIRPPRPKQRKVGVYPLTREIGDAMIAYLQVRPTCTHRRIFITLRQPYHPLSAHAVTSLVKSRQERLGHKPKRFGAHGLRHACATYLLAEGFSLKQIGDHLGHTMVRATEVYAKVDLRSLRQVGESSLAELIECDAGCAAREIPFFAVGSVESRRAVADVRLGEIL